MTPSLRTFTRRDILLALTAGSATGCAHDKSHAVGSPANARTGAGTECNIAEVEARVGGRVGVFALDTGSGRTLGRRADERFAMCSTFKWVLAAAMLSKIDRGQAASDYGVHYGEADLLDYAPIAREHVAEGSLTVETLARAAITVSDNTAANLLLALVGGPPGLTAFVRQAGDPITRLDRTEPALNSNDPGDPRDTTSPRAMVGLMRAVLCGDALKSGSRERLLDWMKACETGKKRLRAGLPSNWFVGDKTGTGENAAVNDLAIAVPQGRRPILIAACMSEGIDEDDGSKHEAAHVAVARLVARELG